MSNHNLWAFINPHKTLQLLLLIQNHRISEPQTYLRYDLNRKMFPLQESVGSILRLFFLLQAKPSFIHFYSHLRNSTSSHTNVHGVFSVVLIWFC